MRRLFRETETLLTDVECKLGEPLLPDTADDPLHVHLTQAEEEDWTTVSVKVEPAPREIVPYHRGYLNDIIAQLISNTVCICQNDLKKASCRILGGYNFEKSLDNEFTKLLLSIKFAFMTL